MNTIALRALVLISSILVGMPVGSFYSWSVFINPLRLARPNFTTTASVHANSVVIAALAVACALTGKLLRCVSWGCMPGPSATVHRPVADQHSFLC
jgi:hypothetical protein